jgi:nucleoside 2-deoxyribosyltransferase
VARRSAAIADPNGAKKLVGGRVIAEFAVMTGTQITERCEICRQSTQVYVDFDSENRTPDCPRCGRYRITRGAMALLEQDRYTEVQRSRLSAATRRATENNGFADITQAMLPILIDSVTPPRYPTDVADEILLRLFDRGAPFGTPLPFDIETIYPLFALVNPGALSNVVQYMAGTDLIKLDSGTPAHLTLRPRGYDRVKELRATTKASRRAFVAISFDPQYRPTYDDAIKPAIESVGFDPIRMDDLPHNDRIDERIIVEIRRSAFLVADFSDPRTGVFFEAGYALGYGLPVIWTCSAEKFGEVPKHFDTRQFNHIRWENTDDLRLQLKTRLLATIPGAAER